MQILVDFLTFSDKEHDLSFWIEKLNLSELKFTDIPSRNGYQFSYSCSGVTLREGGTMRDDICIDLSGSGCRCIESCNGCDFNWISFFKSLQPFIDDKIVHISRLDLAADDREEEILNFQTIFRAAAHHRYISRSRYCSFIGGSEEAVYFGSPRSDTRVRIYNKALERHVDEHWVRCEMQLRDKAALSCYRNLLLYEDVGRVYSGILLNYLRFTVKAPDKNNNNNRIPTSPWWDKFLGTAERIKNIYEGGLEYNLDNLENFLIRQCSSSLKTYLMLHDLSDLLDIVDRAELSRKQKDLVQQFDIMGW